MFANQEATIVQRLKDTMPEGVYVGTLDELEKVVEMRQRAPAVWVIYDGYIVQASPNPASKVVLLRQDWFVVVATKSAKGSGTAAVAKNEASALALTALGALIGYPLGEGKYLQVSDAPGPEYDAGYCHVPLAFASAATFKATN